MGELVVIAMTIVALALIIGMSVNGIVEKVQLAKRLRHETVKAPASAELQAIAEQTQMIEDRLRVLERIATDRGNLLADEIESLRHDTRMLAPGQRQTEGAAQ